MEQKFHAHETFVSLAGNHRNKKGNMFVLETHSSYEQKFPVGVETHDRASLLHPFTV